MIYQGKEVEILVLEKVMKSAQNRFLLADEVGMGKK